ncbi:MAG: hypothetical protein ACLPPF_23430 [Rhodomicrobium sp.]
MLANRGLQRSVIRGEIACISAVTRSVLRVAEHPIAGAYFTTVSFLRVDGQLLCDAISIPAPENLESGYWAIPLDEIVSG